MSAWKLFDNRSSILMQIGFEEILQFREHLTNIGGQVILSRGYWFIVLWRKNC